MKLARQMMQLKNEIIQIIGLKRMLIKNALIGVHLTKIIAVVLILISFSSVKIFACDALDEHYVENAISKFLDEISTKDEKVEYGGVSATPTTNDILHAFDRSQNLDFNATFDKEQKEHYASLKDAGFMEDTLDRDLNAVQGKPSLIDVHYVGRPYTIFYSGKSITKLSALKYSMVIVDLPKDEKQLINLMGIIMRRFCKVRYEDLSLDSDVTLKRLIEAAKNIRQFELDDKVFMRLVKEIDNFTASFEDLKVAVMAILDKYLYY